MDHSSGDRLRRGSRLRDAPDPSPAHPRKMTRKTALSREGLRSLHYLVLAYKQDVRGFESLTAHQVSRKISCTAV
jgi:hypothetical protein